MHIEEYCCFKGLCFVSFVFLCGISIFFIVLRASLVEK